MTRINRHKIKMKKLHEEYKGICAFCGNETSLEEIVEYEGKGCCRECFNYKKSRLGGIDGFKEGLNGLVDELINDSSRFRLALKYGLVEIKKKEVEFYFENKHK